MAAISALAFEILAEACDDVGRERGRSEIRDIARELRGAASVGLVATRPGERVPIEAALRALDKVLADPEAFADYAAATGRGCVTRV